jgi:hypothetical protein
MSTTGNVKQIFNRQEKALKRLGVAAEGASAAYNLFTITGGDILVTGFYGKVRVLIAGAATPRIQFTPAGLALTPMVTAADSIDTDAVNTLYTTDFALATKFNPTNAATGVGLVAWGSTVGYQILVPGVISVTNAGAAYTGIIDYTILYVPLDDTVVVATA